MAKVTTKLQVTVPKTIADRFRIKPGDEIAWEAAGVVIHVIPPGAPRHASTIADRLKAFDSRPNGNGAARSRRAGPSRPVEAEDGDGETCTVMPSLVDTNILAYRFDPTFPEKQRIANEVLRRDAEHYGLSELLSEDFEHGRRYGTVRVVNPFIG